MAATDCDYIIRSFGRVSVGGGTEILRDGCEIQYSLFKNRC